MNNLINEISRFLCLPIEEIRSVVNKSPTLYKRYYINKKKGGKREIFHPAKSLKAIQYAFIHLYLLSLPIHKISIGYIKGLKSPLRMNAKLHSKFKYSVRIDFKDFFSSITSNDLVYYLKKYKLEFTYEDYKLIRKVIFPHSKISKGLPIGAPISPIVSNIVMYDLDNKIYNYSKELDPSSEVTRYVDDIVFSSNNLKFCKQFVKELKKILTDSATPKLSINQKKTMFMSKYDHREITGLVVTPDQKVSIGRAKKRYIKKMLFDCVNNNSSKDEKKYLSGYLAFILDVEPSFYNSLVLKYGVKVNQILKHSEV